MLRFSGVVANDVAELDLPAVRGAAVELPVFDPDEPPRVATSTSGELAGALSRKWSKTEFEEYAVSRGFL
jgi:hypothetical protein